jgi:hypothetical protein
MLSAMVRAVRFPLSLHLYPREGHWEGFFLCVIRYPRDRHECPRLPWWS